MCNRLYGTAALCAALALIWPAFADTPLQSVRVATNLALPGYVVAPPGDLDHLFIVELCAADVGRIQLLNLRTGLLNPAPFFTSAPVGTGNEQGLLGLAFDPNYAANGYFYINYTDPTNTIHIVRYNVSNDPNFADPNSAYPILNIAHPDFDNHNAGWLAFGADGYLYISVGDGGGNNDPDQNAQNTAVLLGKMLCIDVHGDDFPADPNRNYAIPPSNPFVNTPGAAPEIWAYGLRNPWRCSFDRQTHDLYIGDVGEHQFEEIDFQRAGTPGGLNYGWSCMEASQCTGLTTCECNSPTLTPPIYAYPHNGLSAAVMGGYVYRGYQICDLRGTYFFADYPQTLFFSFRFDGTNLTDFRDRTTELTAAGQVVQPTSFGEDAAGELYIVCRAGDVWKIVPAVALPLRGDMNLDGQVNFDDINPFVLGLTDPAGYQATYGVSPVVTGDFNCDGNFDFGDINPFVGALAGP